MVLSSVDFVLILQLSFILILLLLVNKKLSIEGFNNKLHYNEAIELIKNVSPKKITRPNDTSYYGLSKESQTDLNIENEQYENLMPICWIVIDNLYEKIQKNREKIKNLQADVFSSTHRTYKLMDKLEIRDTSEIIDKL